MRQIMVCVDFADILAVTLPRNKHHFDEIWVVTAPRDLETIEVCHQHGACVFLTELFWADGAVFNKFRALEAGLDAMGRRGWLCVGDADVIWPKEVAVEESTNILMLSHPSGRTLVKVGQICSPLRHMYEWSKKDFKPDGQLWIPPEERWGSYQTHRNVNEWAGYCQMFHASDPVLGRPPWHQIDWQHCGGADSFLQNKWSREKKTRTPWNVLHIGAAGQNWFGRAAPRVDTGELPADSGKKLAAMSELWGRRVRLRREGRDQFAPERIKLPDAPSKL